MEFNQYGIQNMWKFDGDSLDSVGEMDGTNVGLTYGEGKVGQGIVTNKTAANRIDCGTMDVRFQDAMSISVWVKIGSIPLVGAPQRVVCKTVDGLLATTPWEVSVVLVGVVAVARVRFNQAVEVLGTTTLLVGNWYFLTMTYDKVNMELLVNGVSEGTIAHTLDIIRNNAVGVGIGNTPTSATLDLPFDGTIDQVIIWNKKLTTADIATLYNSGNGIVNPEYEFAASQNLEQNILMDISAADLGVSGDASRTTSVWIYAYAYSVDAMIYHMGTTATNQAWGLKLNATGNDYQLQFGGGGSNRVQFSYGAANQWIHLVCTYDGANASIYADGALVTSSAIATQSTGTSEAVEIASYLGTQYFSGVIADFRVYSRALSLAEVQTMYAARGVDQIVAGLEGRWLSIQQPVTRWGVNDTPALLGSWVDGTVHAAESGTNRILLFIIGSDDNNALSTTTGVTYGGVAMSLVGRNYFLNGSYYQGISMWYLLDSDIDLAGGSSFLVTWDAVPTYQVLYSSAFFSNVDQKDPISNVLNGGIAGTGATVANTHNNKNNLIVCASSHGSNSGASVSITAGDFTTGSYQEGTYHTVTGAYKVATSMGGGTITFTSATSQGWTVVYAVLNNTVESLKDVGPSGFHQISSNRPRAKITNLRV